MKRVFLIVAAVAVVLLTASASGLQPTAYQPVASDLQLTVGGVDTQAMAYFRLDKTCERGNTRCR